MKLNRSSTEWAIASINRNADGDFFPKSVELMELGSHQDDLVSSLTTTSINTLEPGPARRFVVQKEQLSARVLTQLDPQDSIVLASLMHEYGHQIEQRRLSSDIVFSHRFNPTPEYELYAGRDSWQKYWQRAKVLATDHNHTLFCDIADFYNQISHHCLENQLDESGLPRPATKWIINLLKSTTAGVSRGLPVGPHTSHLLAEASLIPIDNVLVTDGIKFIRFVDDYLFFCDDESEWRHVFLRFANILDTQQRLVIQRHKSTPFESQSFISHCDNKLEEKSINPEEAATLEIVNKYSDGDPYRLISYADISDEDWRRLSANNISQTIHEYLDHTDTDYLRLGWFYRRLAQIGHPGALEVSIDRFQDLIPCLGNVCGYLMSVGNIDPNRWLNIGNKLMFIFQKEQIKRSEYCRLSILSLFASNSELNHMPSLVSLFREGDPTVRREVLLAAFRIREVDWIREYKESFIHMDEWQRRAFILCASLFPMDERRYTLRRLGQLRSFDRTLVTWAKAQT